MELKIWVQLTLATVLFFTWSINAQTCNFEVSEAKKSANAVNGFAWNFYKKIVQTQPNNNVVFSPASIILALSMLEAGADGVTKTELNNVLTGTGAGTGTDSSTVYQALQENLQKTGANVTLKIANGFYTDAAFPFKDQYKSVVEKCFKAKLEQVNFGQTEQCRQKVNAFVAEKTNQKIPELFKTGSFDSDTKAVLVNAIYLTAVWRRPFEASNTKQLQFKRANGTQQTTAFMRTQNVLGYRRTDEVEVLKMPFVNNLAMYFVLPAENLSINSFETGLDAAKFGDLLKVDGDKFVQAIIPKFGVRTPLDLKTGLEQLGMTSLFNPVTANFGRISPRKLVVTKAVHEAFIKVDESGVEAAGATGMVLGYRSRPLDFIANRPFLYAIKHEETNTVLFMGKVNSVETV